MIFWNYSYPAGYNTPALFLDDWRLEDWARGCNSDWQQLVAVTCLIEDSGDCYYNPSLPHLPFLPTVIPSSNTSCNWLEESFIPQSFRLSKYFLVRANNKLRSFINLLWEALKKCDKCCISWVFRIHNNWIEKGFRFKDHSANPPKIWDWKKWNYPP